jgi:transmembrane sensor
MSTDRLWTLIARKLAGECSADELTELSTLLADNSDLHIQLQAIMSAWQNNDQSDVEHMDTEYEKHLSRLKDLGIELNSSEKETSPEIEFIEISPRRRSRKLVYMLCMLLVIGAASLIFVLKGNKKKEAPVNLVADTNNVISTKNGSRTKIELPDGSIAFLNAGSKLTYNKEFGTKLREVQLSGEGFFNVVHDASKPFIIRTAYIDITDLGTEFNVKSYPNDKTSEVSLVHGSVEVTMRKRPNDKWVLKPNEKISVLNVNTVVVEPGNAKNGAAVNKPELPILMLDKVSFDKNGQIQEVAWTKNQLAFVNESMELMATKLERWFGKPVIVQNSNLNTLQFTATFESESMEQVLKALQLSSGKKMNFVIDNDKVVIY